MKSFISFLAATVLSVAAFAHTVDSLTSARLAAGFFQRVSNAKADVLLTDCSGRWQYGHLRLYTCQHGGFVLMADDDAARPILAYSTTATLNPENPPAALVPLLQQYNDEIAAAQRDGASADPDWKRMLQGGALERAAKDDEPDSLGPLVQTQWYQLSPYNMLCPGGCPTGCVATAAAQLMRYWNFPAFGVGSHSYTSDAGYGVLTADFAHTYYDWPNMPLRLTAMSSAAERQAVATLMYHIGVSVHMSYNTIQSGAVAGDHDGDTNAYCSQNALWRFFRYNRQDISYREKGSMSNDEWTDLIIAELQQRRPILYNGRGGAGGHAFICDGYDSRRYLHFNLGEDGEGDGFYAVGAISYGMYNFNMENNCVMGIHPDYGIYLSDPSLSFDRTGGTKQVALATCDTSDAPWTASCSASWLHIADTGFLHFGLLSVIADENTTGADRTATIVFSQLGRSAVLSVTQNAYSESDYCTLTVVMECTRSGSSWANYAHLSFESPSGLVYGTAAHTSTDRTSTATVRVAPGTLIVRYHRGGPQDRYYNYWVIDPVGDTLIAVENAYYNGDDVTIENPCHTLAIDDAPSGLGPLPVVFPNPTDGIVNIDANGCNIKEIIIHDAKGQTVSVRSFPVDLSALPSGVYFLSVITDKEITTTKIIKR